MGEELKAVDDSYKEFCCYTGELRNEALAEVEGVLIDQVFGEFIHLSNILRRADIDTGTD